MFDVAAMAGAFGDDNLSGPFASAQLDGGGDHQRIRIDHLVAMILDDVGLEDDALTGQGKTLAKVIELTMKDSGQVGVVVRNWGYMNLGGSRNLAQPSGRLDSHAPYVGFQSLRPGDATGGGGKRKRGRGRDARRVQAKNVA